MFMENRYLAIAFDRIIETYKSEASQYSTYCPEEMLYALDQLYNAQLHALESIKKILTNE